DIRSRFCRGSSSSLFQSPRSFAHPGLPLLDCCYLYIGFPDFPSGNTKPFGFIFQAPPLAGWPNRCRFTTPLGSVGLRRLHRYYGVSRPLAPLPYSRPFGSGLLWLLRFIGAEFPMFRIIASVELKPPIYAGYRPARKQVPSELVPRPSNKPRFDMV